MRYIDSLDVNIQRQRALDFGCGVGRLTQPLCQFFDEVYGVDIAQTMIDLANKYNKHKDKCRYYLNQADNLNIFPDNYFDFIYTNIVLQHIEPKYTKNYIKEFLRVLCPGGLLIFQLPSEIRVVDLKTRIFHIVSRTFHITPEALLDLYYKMKYRNKPRIEMHRIKREDVIKLLESSGAKIIDIIEDNSAGKQWLSFRYCVTKE